MADEELSVEKIEELLKPITRGTWKPYYRVSPRGAYKQWHIGNEDGLCQITMHGREVDYMIMAAAPSLARQLIRVMKERDELRSLVEQHNYQTMFTDTNVGDD